MQLSTKHLLGIRDLLTSDIQTILDTATQFKEVLQRPIKKFLLRDVTIVNLFYENSTRTRFHLNWQKKTFCRYNQFYCFGFFGIQRRKFARYRQ